MTASQIMTENMIDETITATTSIDLSDDEHQENSRITNNTNGHPDLQ